MDSREAITGNFSEAESFATTFPYGNTTSDVEPLSRFTERQTRADVVQRTHQPTLKEANFEKEGSEALRRQYLAAATEQREKDEKNEEHPRESTSAEFYNKSRKKNRSRGQRSVRYVQNRIYEGMFNYLDFKLTKTDIANIFRINITGKVATVGNVTYIYLHATNAKLDLAVVL